MLQNSGAINAGAKSSYVRTGFAGKRGKPFLSASSADIRVALPPELGKKSCRFFPVEEKIL